MSPRKQAAYLISKNGVCMLAFIAQYKKTATLIISSLISFNAFSDVVISGTRVIYKEGSKEVLVKLENQGKNPLLIQSWLDDGRPDVNPEEMKVPFVITPAVSRIDPKKGQTVRVSYTGQTLPQDKESMYWFNVLEIPPKAQPGNGKNLLQLAFRTRIKFIYRPKELKGSAVDAISELKWRLLKENNNSFVEVKNASQYYVSLTSASLTTGGKKHAIVTEMLPPLSSKKLKVDTADKLSGGSIKYSAVNDFGGATENEVTL